MKTASRLAFGEHFRDLEDPRIERTKRHLLMDIVLLAILGVISDAEGWEQIAEFGRQKKEWLKTILQLPHGIPSPDTIARVFQRLKPEEFQRCFLSWTGVLAQELGLKHIVLDGKTLRRSSDRASGKRPLHLVSAWSAANRLVLGQQAVDGKSNEITAIPALLQLLEVKGAIISIDAIGCQKSIAEQIVNAGADYILSLKDNQPSLHNAVTEYFEKLHTSDFSGPEARHVRRHTTREQRGDVTITREYYLAPLPQELSHFRDSWRKLTSIGQVITTVEQGDDMKIGVRFYISSLSARVKRFANAVRNHWTIENSLHWVLDMTFREDESRLHKGHGQENMALLRRLVLSLLRRDNSPGSLRIKRKRAAWNPEALLNLVCQAG
jgi:predicted transposase YbfD/YdcC